MSARLKIPSDAVETIRAAIATLDTEDVRESYRTGDYPRADRTNDVDKRYRWDLLHAVDARGMLPWRVWDLYDRYDVNDSHIDSALRSIVVPLGSNQ